MRKMTLLLIASYSLGLWARPAPVTKEEKAQVRKSFDRRTLVAHADGGWSGSGGDGVACFASPDDVQKAVDTNGDLTEFGRQHMQKFFALDLFEFKNKYHFVGPEDGESVMAYLKRVLHLQLGDSSPYFEKRLLQALDLVEPNGTNVHGWPVDWEDRPLPHIDDIGPTIDPGGRCVPVQWAIRYRQPTDGDFPRIFVDFDGELMNEMDILFKNSPRLAFLNKAAILLHEALGLVGVELGQKDSSKARHLTAALLSREFDLFVHSRAQQFHAMDVTTILYSIGFEEISWLFMPPNAKYALPYTKLSRQRARGELERKYSKNLKVVGVPKNQPLTDESEATIMAGLAQILDDEEAFIFISNNEANANRLSQSPDVFLMDDTDDSALAKELCGSIRSCNVEVRKVVECESKRLASRQDCGLKYENEGFFELMKAAERYCDGWSESPRGPLGRCPMD